MQLLRLQDAVRTVDRTTHWLQLEMFGRVTVRWFAGLVSTNRFFAVGFERCLYTAPWPRWTCQGPFVRIQPGPLVSTWTTSARRSLFYWFCFAVFLGGVVFSQEGCVNFGKSCRAEPRKILGMLVGKESYSESYIIIHTHIYIYIEKKNIYIYSWPKYIHFLPKASSKLIIQLLSNTQAISSPARTWLECKVLRKAFESCIIWCQILFLIFYRCLASTIFWTTSVEVVVLAKPNVCAERRKSKDAFSPQHAHLSFKPTSIPRCKFQSPAPNSKPKIFGL